MKKKFDWKDHMRVIAFVAGHEDISDADARRIIKTYVAKVRADYKETPEEMMNQFLAPLGISFELPKQQGI